MNDKPVTPAAPGKQRRGLKILGGLSITLVALGIIAYFVGTSAGFFKSVILPRVSKAANATVTVDDASLSPFSQVILRNLKVQTTGSEALVTAGEVHLRYHLLDILGGKINVDEATLISPVINLVENADGTSNLDPLLKSNTPKDSKPTPAKTSGPPQLNLKKLALSNATVRRTKHHQAGPPDVTELSNVNLTLDDLKNGATGKLTLGADVKADNHPPSPGVAGALQAKVAGDFTFALTADLQPQSVKGSTRLEVTQATGAFKDLAALGMNFDCDLTPADIRQVALRFQKSGTPLGMLRVSGPFDLAKSEGKLTVEMLGLDRQLLNLAGAGSGLDFGGTTINATNQIELGKSGAALTASGRLNVANFQVTSAGQATPVLDLLADYNVAVDQSAKSAQVRSLTLTATQNRSPLLRAELSSPMNLNWGGGAGTGDSALNVEVTGLNLADWRAFAAGLAPAGLVNAKLKLLSQQGGKQLNFDLDSQIAGLSAKFGSNSVNRADVRVIAKGQSVDFQKFTLENYRLELAQLGETALSVSGTGTFDQTAQAADFQIAVKAALVKLLAIFPQPNLKLAGGKLDFQGHLTSQAQNQTVTGELVVADLAASATPDKVLTAKLKLDAARVQQVAELRQCLLTLTPTTRARNELSLTGKVDLSKPDAMTGGLKLAAESLDLTAYYDMFTGQTAPAAKTQPAPAPNQQEPAAVTLPFHLFTVEAVIGRLYLRAVDVANFTTTLKLDGGQVLLKPFQMTLNGAPVNATADLNLAFPGYQYDVTFKADGVPIAPLTDTFSPAYQGKASGELLAGGKIQGAGLTGRNLHKNLQGDASVVLTNANVQLAGPKAKLLITPIALVLGLNELTRAPLTGLNAQLKMGAGKITLTKCDVLSDAFLADTAGDIFIAPVLNDSLFNYWPINVSLSRELASKAHLMPANTPTNAAFVRLPNFVTLGGTLGTPAPKTDKVVILGLAAQSVGGLTKGLGGDAGKIIQGVGSLLTGKKNTGTPTNSPATNAQPANLLDPFKKK